MKQFFELPEQERRLIIDEASRIAGLNAFHVEKDYWACWLLDVLFKDSRLRGKLAFRGGTSLSKGWKCIDRFSEDLDLAISRDCLGEESIEPTNRMTQGQMKRLRKNCRSFITGSILPVVQREANTELSNSNCVRLDDNFEKARDPFVVWFDYPSVTQANPTPYFQSSVKLEFSARADGTPVEERAVISIVAENLPVLKPEEDSTVSCVHPHRTFWEKIALIHERNTNPQKSAPAERMSRHLYDIHRIWTANVLPSNELHRDPLFDVVMRHRQVFFEYGWVDHESMTTKDLRIIPSDAQIHTWESDYKLMRSMFFTTPPKFEEILSSLREIELRLKAD